MEKDINLREDILSNQRNFLLSSIDSLTEYEEVTLEDYMKNWLPLTRALREIELSKKMQDVNYDEFWKNSKEFKDKFFDFRLNYPELFLTQIYKKTLDFFKALSENSSEFEAGELSRSIKTNES